MYTFNFVTKEVGTIFDPIKTFVLAQGFKGRAIAGARKEDCSVIGENGYFHVGYPIELLGSVVLFDLQSATKGRILINDCCIKYTTRCYFQIKDTTLYLTEEF